MLIQRGLICQCPSKDARKGYQVITCEVPLESFIQSSTRMPVERACGMLKARFCILLKRCDMDLQYVPDLGAACLVLPKICYLYLPWRNISTREAEESLALNGRVEEN